MCPFINEVGIPDLHRIRHAIVSGVSIEDILPTTIGSKSIGGGLWRFFPSNAMGCFDAAKWNQHSTWKYAWGGFLPPHMHCFGEDVFGNQLITILGQDNTRLWFHENGNLHDLLVSLCELLETVFNHGFGWIDFYRNGALEVAKSVGLPPASSHIHWTTPLILGGRVTSDNVTVIARGTHLVGHGKLWAQLNDIDHGAGMDSG